MTEESKKSGSPKAPEPTGRSREYIETLAASISHKLGYASGGDLKAIVENIGGKVVVGSRQGGNENGSILVEGPRNFTIFLSRYTGPLRDRFTIAHELGHYFLHSLMGEKQIVVKREGSNLTEWEANWFAAGFLMPQEEFTEKWAEFNKRIGPMAGHFDVSTQTISIRRESLGL